jgi:hypothetical protein
VVKLQSMERKEGQLRAVVHAFGRLCALGRAEWIRRSKHMA